MKTVLPLLLTVSSAPLGAQHFHRLPATPHTVAYGYYSAAATPVLHLTSGDTVEVETLITNRPDRLEAAGVAPADVQQSLRDIVAQVTDKGPGGHILTGPIYIEGADSGDVLEVRILRIDLALTYGYNGCSGFLPANCDSTHRTRIIPLDRKRKVAQFAPGIVETSLTGRLQFIVRKDLHLTWPRAETRDHFIAMGMDKDLTKATQIAVQNAIDFIAERRNWSKMEAYRLVSVACDVRVTELVDGNVGVHVMIPKSIMGR